VDVRVGRQGSFSRERDEMWTPGSRKPGHLRGTGLVKQSGVQSKELVDTRVNGGHQVSPSGHLWVQFGEALWFVGGASRLQSAGS